MPWYAFQTVKRFNYKNYFVNFASVTATEFIVWFKNKTNCKLVSESYHYPERIQELPKIKCFKNCEEYMYQK